MVWGGSLNKKGSNYIRKLREADRVMAFLENLKEHVNPKERTILSETIGIIMEYISKISEEKEK